MWKSFNNKSGDTFYSQCWFCAASITRRRCFTRALQAPNAAVFQGNPTKGLLPISKPWEEQSSNITEFLLQTGKLHVQGVAEALGGAWLFIGPINILLRPCELNKQKRSRCPCRLLELAAAPPSPASPTAKLLFAAAASQDPFGLSTEKCSSVCLTPHEGMRIVNLLTVSCCHYQLSLRYLERAQVSLFPRLSFLTLQLHTPRKESRVCSLTEKSCFF